MMYNSKLRCIYRGCQSCTWKKTIDTEIILSKEIAKIFLSILHREEKEKKSGLLLVKIIYSLLGIEKYKLII